MFIRLTWASCLFIFFLPHIFAYMFSKNKEAIKEDIIRNSVFEKSQFHIPYCLQLEYLLYSNAYFRTLFYHRIGRTMGLLLGGVFKGDKYFIISPDTMIGKGMLLSHPYSTVINAERIGDHCQIMHCTTIGKWDEKRPNIGNNVFIGANVNIIGGVTIGDNVRIGAGSVVVKDIPSNTVAVGVPCRPVRTIDV